jgi:hypothetical protein
MQNPGSTFLDRHGASALLGELGIPCAAATLATLATRGGGPLFVKFGSRALYRRDDLVEWARARLTAPRRSTSEVDARRVDAA